jgi:hypothetical protein
MNNSLSWDIPVFKSLPELLPEKNITNNYIFVDIPEKTIRDSSMYDISSIELFINNQYSFRNILFKFFKLIFIIVFIVIFIVILLMLFM